MATLSLPKKPKQSFWNKIRDVFDANTEADKYRRNLVAYKKATPALGNASVGIKRANNSQPTTKISGIWGTLGSLGKDAYNVGKGITGAAINTVQMPYTAARNISADITNNPVAKQNARQAWSQDMNNNFFWNPTYEKAADVTASALYSPTYQRKNEQANQQMANVISRGYGNTPQAKMFTDYYKSAQDQADLEGYLANQGLNMKSSGWDVTKKVGLPIVSAAAQTAMQATGLGAGARMVTQGEKEIGKQLFKQANKTGMMMGGLGAVDTLANDGNIYDALKNATTGYMAGAAMPVMGYGVAKVGKTVVKDYAINRKIAEAQKIIDNARVNMPKTKGREQSALYHQAINAREDIKLYNQQRSKAAKFFDEKGLGMSTKKEVDNTPSLNPKAAKWNDKEFIARVAVHTGADEGLVKNALKSITKEDMISKINDFGVWDKEGANNDMLFWGRVMDDVDARPVVTPKATSAEVASLDATAPTAITKPVVTPIEAVPESAQVEKPNVVKRDEGVITKRDVAEVQKAAKEAHAVGDIETANMLIESLPPKYRIKLDKPTVTQRTVPEGVDPITGEVKTPKPEVRYKRSADYQAKPMQVLDETGQPTKLGNIVETFYKNKKGDNKIKFTQLESIGKEINRQIDTEYAQLGTDTQTVFRKVQEAVNKKIKTLKEAGLTDAEADVLRRAQAEMNYVRRKAGLGKKEIKAGDLGEMYIPRQVEGQYAGDNLFEGFMTTKPGSEFKRTGKMKLDEIDYSSAPIGDYIVRYGDTKLYQRERIARAVKKANPEVAEEVVDAAVTKIVQLQNKVNKIENKIGLGGFGRRKSLSDGEFVDSAAELSRVGRDLGRRQLTVNETPDGFTNGDRVNSVEIVPGRTVGDYTGLNQHRDALSFASKEFADSGGDKVKLAESVRQRLTKDYNIDEDSVNYLSDSISRIADNVPDEVVIGRVESAYKLAAKQQMMEKLQHINITNKTLRKDVSDLTNQILREGTTENKASTKIVRGVLKTTNAIFRKFNISSALNELSDLNSFLSVYGKKAAILKPNFRTIKEFGLGEIDAAIEPYLKQLDKGASFKSVAKKINNATNLYKFVEYYKAAVVATSAKKFYKNLSGDALTKQVLKDYRELALPVDAFTKTFLDSAPLYTQYMSWGMRNLQKEGRLLSGKIDAGVMKDKSIGQRMARNAYVNLPAKTVFWLASNGLKGTSILTAFGLTDFTGMTNQDYSGIADEDKSWFDRTTQFTGSSTTFSLLNSVVQSLEKEGLKEKYKNADYNPYENNDLDSQIMSIFTPQAVKNARDANTMMNQGYSINKAGRVQYEAPTDFWNTAKAYIFGKNQTANAREYGGRQNIVERVQQGQNPLSAMKDMALEQTGFQDTKYTRPLSEEYSQVYKETPKELRTAVLNNGREYNAQLDNLKRNKPEEYNRYINSMDGNHVNPEFWREIIGGNASSGTDLTVYKMMQARKQQLYKDMTAAGKNQNGEHNYDPLYDLSDDKARLILQTKAAATGDDISLRNNLWQEEWYQDYQDKVSAFYDGKQESSDSNYKESERVKTWNTYNSTYGALKGYPSKDFLSKNGDILKEEFPLIWQSKQYEYGTPEAKAWFSNNYDAYEAEKAVYDETVLGLINKMREVEGFAPMSMESYQQAKNVKDTDSSGGWASSKPTINPSDYMKKITVSGVVKPKLDFSLPKVEVKKRGKVKKPTVTIKKGTI